MFINARNYVPAPLVTAVNEHDMEQSSLSCSVRSCGSSEYRSKWIELFLSVM
jgi:hypothetical protein